MLVGLLYISTGIQNADARTGFKSQKCMCNTHNSNNDKTDQENNDTSILEWQKHQHSRIVVSLFGEWGHCNCHHNADAGNKDWLASGTIRVEPERMLLSLVVYCGFRMREKRWSDNLVSNLIWSESCVWTQSLMLVLNGNCCSIPCKCQSLNPHCDINQQKMWCTWYI